MSEDGGLATDAIQIAQRALARLSEEREQRQQLEQTVDELSERIVAMEVRLEAADQEQDYRDLSLDEKVGRVREHLFSRAQASGGRAALDYNDIVWSVFDGEPSADHAYKLMRLAADVDGFDVENPRKGNKKLTVDVRQAKRSAAFSSANKAVSEEGL